VSTIEELLEEKLAAPVYKTENTAIGIRHRPRGTLYAQKLALTSPKSGGRSVIVRWRTQVTEFVFHFYSIVTHMHDSETSSYTTAVAK
jgi:hypothetical protein